MVLALHQSRDITSSINFIKQIQALVESMVVQDLDWRYPKVLLKLMVARYGLMIATLMAPHLSLQYLADKV